MGIPLVAVFEGIPQMFTNSSQLHAAAILENQYLINSKCQELRVEAVAEKVTAIPPEDGAGSALA